MRLTVKKLIIATGLMASATCSQAELTLDEFDAQSYAFRGSLALAGMAPPGFNAFGAAIAGGLLTPGGSTEAINDMNERLVNIQSDLDSIKKMISGLRAGVLSDFQTYMTGRDYITIESRLNYAINTLKDEYENYSDGRSSEDRAELLDSLHDLMAETITWFTTDASLSDTEKLATVGEFMALVTVHMSILQELVEIYRERAYVDCAGSLCDKRIEVLNTNVNIFAAKIDRYNEYLDVIAENARKFRLSQIDKKLSFDIHSLEYCAPPGHRCVDYGYRVNYYAKDKATGYKLSTGYVHDSEADEVEAKAKEDWAAYTASAMAEFDAKLADEIASVQKNLKISKQNYEFVDHDIYADGCVRFYANTDFSGEYRTMCSSSTQLATEPRTKCVSKKNFLGQWYKDCDFYFNWGSLGSDISSVAIGPNATVNLYSDIEYSGSRIILEGQQSVNLQDQGFDNTTRSIKVY